MSKKELEKYLKSARLFLEENREIILELVKQKKICTLQEIEDAIYLYNNPKKHLIWAMRQLVDEGLLEPHYENRTLYYKISIDK